MLTFIIPVKSKKVSGSWDHFSSLFERTLKSVSGQTSDQFRIVVVCHEKPNTSFDHPSIEYVHVDFEPPVLKPEEKEKHDGLKEQDKTQKIKVGLEHIKEYQQDYVMVADADDCISNTLVAFVDKHKSDSVPGWYFKKGFIYREGDKFIALNKENFNTLCGTCIIVKPKLVKHIFKKKPHHILYAHGTVSLTDDLSLKPLPFPGSIYSMANGENHYMTGNMIQKLNSSNLFSMETVKGIIRKLRKYRVRTLSGAIKNEFGLYNITDNV